MKYEKSERYLTPELMAKIMGPNPVKLTEELLIDCKIPENARIMDLGSGQGLTSVFMAKEYGFTVYAADLWSDPEENRRFFIEMGLSDEQIIPVKADATDLPFEKEFFDGVVSTDSYNYFGRDKDYLDNCLLPYVKKGGYIYITVPGMKKDLHDNLPPELLLSWTPEQLDYIHDIAYWQEIVSASSAEVVSVYEMESNEEVWADWLKQDNEYAAGDRKTMEAGGGKYLNFIGIVLRKK
ncbi:MAG: SAM-dependent methyltransferase [Ruminiclostridium sp.]